MSLFILAPLAHAQGLNGFFDMSKNNSKQYEDGSRTLSSDTLNRNLYLNVHEPITPVLSYQFNLRTNYFDSETTDALDITSKRYVRSIEPALDLILGNPSYSLSAGIRRREQWTAAHMNNDNRKTNEYYYSRFSLSPELLPSLTLQLDRQRNYDYLTPRAVNNSNSVYSINSAYDLPSGDLKFRYTVNYSYAIYNTPLTLNNKTISDNFNGTYNIGYSGRFWQNRADYSLGYQGNYSRNRTEQFVTQTGTVLNKRIPFGGFHKYNPADPALVTLDPKGDLINTIFSSTGINIGFIIPASTNTNHNIGILVSPENSVDRLYIYVNKDVSGDSNLKNISNWDVYKSTSNSTWEKIDIKEVTTVTVDDVNNIYRYEIKFLSAHNASYFKVVNLATSALGLTDVFVTEIEALGTDQADEEKLIDASNSFTQQLGFNTSLRPTSKLTFALNYTIDRSDQNMVSVVNSVGGIVENIFSDSFRDDKWNFRSTITRGYSASTTWLTHRFLATSFRVQRNESFDNKEETDTASNSFNLSFFTEPIPTLNANLSLIRSDNFSFDDKSSTNDSVLLSIGSRLYRDLNMITDIIYTNAYSFDSETTSTTQQINGTLDALLTRKLSGTFTYHVSRTMSDSTASDSKDASVFITYRPGKLINLSANFKITDSDGETSTAEGILLDWLPLPAVRLNANYQHSDSEPGPVRTDTINGYIIWYVTKFADVRFINSYSKQVDNKETENYSMSASLNCRF
ncbi:MAG: hypothetical protein C4581_00730 [Nitrospiraceae bacterium]|nr:MAG: hypothetical protein C4581_00730 [Nitrospiraceae bacterium]